jgi:O-antigen ligase
MGTSIPLEVDRAAVPDQSPGGAPPVAVQTTGGAEGATICVGLILLAVFVSVLPVGYDYDRFALPKEFAVLALALSLLTVAIRRRATLEIGAADWLILLGLLGGALSAALADNKLMALRAISLSAAAALTFWLAQTLRAERTKVMACLVWALGIAAGLALAEASGLLDAMALRGRGPAGSAGNRNYLAHVLALGLPVLSWAVLSREAVAIRWEARIALTLSFCALTVTRCRSAWMSVLILMVVAVVTAAVRRRSYNVRLRSIEPLGWAALGVVVALLAPWQVKWAAERPYQQTLARLVDFSSGTGRGRLQQYVTSLQIVTDNPVLGVGPGNWSVHYAQVARADDASLFPGNPVPVQRFASSDYVAALAEYGTLPTLLFLLALGAIAASLLRSRRGSERAWALIGLGTMLVAGIVASVDAVLQRAEPVIVCALVLGLCFQRTASPTIRVPLAQRPLFAGALLLPLLLGALFAGRRICAAVIANPTEPAQRVARLSRAWEMDRSSYSIGASLAFHLMEESRCPEAILRAKEVLSLFPSHPGMRALVRGCESGAVRRGPTSCRSPEGKQN